MRIIYKIGLILVILIGFSAGFLLEPEYKEHNKTKENAQLKESRSHLTLNYGQRFGHVRSSGHSSLSPENI